MGRRPQASRIGHRPPAARDGGSLDEQSTLDAERLEPAVQLIAVGPAANAGLGFVEPAQGRGVRCTPHENAGLIFPVFFARRVLLWLAPAHSRPPDPALDVDTEAAGPHLHVIPRRA